MNNNDTISAIVFFLMYFTSKDFANQFAPFAGIALAATAGAVWYISKQGPMSAKMATGLFFGRFLIAVALSSALAELIQVALIAFGANVQLPRSVVIPIAFLLAGFTDELKDMLTAFWGKYGKRT